MRQKAALAAEARLQKSLSLSASPSPENLSPDMFDSTPDEQNNQDDNGTKEETVSNNHLYFKEKSFGGLRV